MMLISLFIYYLLITFLRITKTGRPLLGHRFVLVCLFSFPISDWLHNTQGLIHSHVAIVSLGP